MNGNNQDDFRSENGDQIANMSKLDFLLLLWEARIIGEESVEANSSSAQVYLNQQV